MDPGNRMQIEAIRQTRKLRPGHTVSTKAGPTTQVFACWLSAISASHSQQFLKLIRNDKRVSVHTWKRSCEMRNEQGTTRDNMATLLAVGVCTAPAPAPALLKGRGIALLTSVTRDTWHGAGTVRAPGTWPRNCAACQGCQPERGLWPLRPPGASRAGRARGAPGAGEPLPRSRCSSRIGKVVGLPPPLPPPPPPRAAAPAARPLTRAGPPGGRRRR